ncbi:MAG: fluoride efflux transporter CrcB [Halomonadaceae bacterium]|nr:MAG: fluoride efflux transporter CrcB [Halomonadaceae bacterium]
MLTWLAVALGGAGGGVLRYWVSGLVTGYTGEVFPWGTMVVNLTGALVVGALAVLAGTQSWFGGELTGLLILGFCGSYTTVSSFSLQTLTLMQAGDWSNAFNNIFLSLFGCMTALWLGATGMRLLLAGGMP